MFCKKRQNVVQTPLDGCIWTRLGVLVLMNREVQKKGGKDPKIGVNRVFSHACQYSNKTSSWQGRSRWSQRVIGGKSWQEKGLHGVYICIAKWKYTYARRNPKKNENNQVRLVTNNCFSISNTQRVKQAKKAAKTLCQDTTKESKQAIYIHNVWSEKENFSRKESCAKRGITTDKNLRKQTRWKYELFVQKNKLSVRKNVAKNKTSEQLHM